MNASSYILPLLLFILFVFAVIKKVKIYDCFVSGAKDALPFSASVFPFLVAVLIIAELFEQSGLSDSLAKTLSPVSSFFNIPTELTKLILLKPFSGSGSLALLSDVFTRYGADSYIARCASVLYGSSETVFYVSAVYFARAKNKNLFLPIAISLFAYFCSIVFACFLCNIM